MNVDKLLANKQQSNQQTISPLEQQANQLQEKKNKREQQQQKLHSLMTTVYHDIANKITETNDQLEKLEKDYKKHLKSFDDIAKQYRKPMLSYIADEFNKNWGQVELEREEGLLQEEQESEQKQGQNQQQELNDEQGKLQRLQQEEQNGDANPLLSAVYVEYCLKILQRLMEREQKMKEEDLQKKQDKLQQKGKAFQQQVEQQQQEKQTNDDMEENAIVEHNNKSGDYEQEMEQLQDNDLTELNVKYRSLKGLYNTYATQLQHCSIEDGEKILNDFKRGSQQLMDGEEVIAKQYNVEKQDDNLKQAFQEQTNNNNIHDTNNTLNPDMNDKDISSDKNNTMPDDTIKKSINNNPLDINFGNYGVKNTHLKTSKHNHSSITI